MTLQTSERETFQRDGMLARRGLVPEHLTTPAIDLVTSWCETRMDPARITEYTQRTFAPELGNTPTLLDLFTRSGAADIARALLSDPAPVTTTQVQIRIPATHTLPPQPEKAMHVDGVGCPHLDPEELRTFSLLVGVVLSPITTPDGGALRYLAGGHHSMAAWFSSEWKLGITEQVPPDMDASTGTPFLGNVGDVLFMHHLVPHAVGINTTSTPRLMAYFRVSHREHHTRRLAALKDPWLDYPCLQS